MKILALEFSSPRRSAAVLVPGATPAEVFALGDQRGALSLVDEALRQARCEREDIECIAIGIGPGSYAGIRAAIALAQGWQLARPVKLLALSSADCLAAQACVAGLTGIINIAVDAQRGEFYLGRYEVDATGWSAAGALKLVSGGEIEACLARGEAVIGPDGERGHKKVLPMFPRAAELARHAEGRGDYVTAESLEPVYLRAVAFVKTPPPRIIPPAA